MKISVAMCTYNGARFVREQLESIATQIRLPDELVVGDDASSDNTPQIVEDFASRVAFPVRLSVNPINVGSTKNFERAIWRCNGDVIALCDQDDIWLPEKLARLSEAFEKSPDAGLAFSNATLINEEDQVLDQTLWSLIGVQKRELYRLKRGRAVGDLLSGATVTGATAAFRTTFRELVLPIPDHLPLIHDAWIALLIGCIAAIVPVDEQLMKYRSHDAQQVGPLKRISTSGGLKAVTQGKADEALRRTNDYDAIVRVAEAARERLLNKTANGFNSDTAVRELESRIKHLRARATMPHSRFRRLPHVARELMTRRYSLYSNGLFSALKDLFVDDTSRRDRADAT